MKEKLVSWAAKQLWKQKLRAEIKREQNPTRKKALQAEYGSLKTQQLDLGLMRRIQDKDGVSVSVSAVPRVIDFELNSEPFHMLMEAAVFGEVGTLSKPYFVVKVISPTTYTLQKLQEVIVQLIQNNSLSQLANPERIERFFKANLGGELHWVSEDIYGGRVAHILIH